MFVYRFAFVSALALTGAAVFWRGGKWEQLAFAMLAVDFVASPLLQVRSSWLNPQLAVFVVDLAFLIGLVWVAYRRQVWTLSVIAALQALYTLLYVPFWLFPNQIFRAFYLAGNALGYVEEATLIAGCMLAPSPAKVFRPKPATGQL